VGETKAVSKEQHTKNAMDTNACKKDRSTLLRSLQITSSGNLGTNVTSVEVLCVLCASSGRRQAPTVWAFGPFLGR
jgi:hypothetical protein